MAKRSQKPIALDLFCGSGAVSLGLKQAGFKVAGAVDFDAGACRTYRANHPEVRLLEKDIREASPEEFADLIPGKLDLLVVCAPCQPFSSQNRHKSKDDSRNNLVEESQKFIKRFEPSLVFLENVPGLASTDIFDGFTAWLREERYVVAEPMRVDASELGVPQRRTRMILVAAKGVSLEKATSIARTGKKTVGEVIRDLPSPPVGRESAGADPLHYARKHSPLNIERLRHIPIDGGGRESLPPNLQLACHKNTTKKGSFSDTYGRMAWNSIAPTLTTGCTDITRGRYAHPEQNRAITLREAARLQTFPDSYVFHGNASQVATQIGNAVPPEMMRNIASSLKAALQA
ncbi:DNA cytosine methyltransferase [Pseudomonas sp. GOM7]|uniref:DNA cytosine methyltransferase n=1 Tax=Pseudomonas sp. GOM7 TaxID=2998079 RepID=UPI00227D6D45|nr:DNA cytosine methyltransferase [Pseudomonas sp. GOM7]WAJ38604.1 DNA cytosine methyltransferase [Pseudomonas sp. GOM7]